MKKSKSQIAFILLLSASVTHLFALSACQSPNSTPYQNDHYASYTALAKKEIKGKDYEVTVRDNKSDTTIMAIHGGYINPHTSEIAKAIAGKTFNLYLFEGLSNDPNKNLHISSHRFNDPQVLQLAQFSEKCLSIQGYKGQIDKVCVGGNDPQFRLEVIEALNDAELPFEVELFCENLEGVHPENIVNKCPYGGVQLEISSSLRDKMMTHKKLFTETTQALHEVMNRPRRYIKIYNQEPEW